MCEFLVLFFSFFLFSRISASDHNLETTQRRHPMPILLYLSSDQDGGIDANEIGSVMRSFGQNPTSAELQELIDEFDKDHDGSIDAVEFKV